MAKKKPMTQAETEVYHTILENPLLSQIEIAHKLNLSRSTVSVHISNLMKKGYILGRSYVIGEYEHAVVIGAAMVDLYGKSFDVLIPQDSNPGEISIYPGGVSRNISENLARLGIKVSLITSLSNDPFSELIRRNSSEVGINLTHSYENRDEVSTMYVAILDQEGDMQLALSDTTALDNMPLEHIQAKKSVIEHADILVIDASLPSEIMQYLAHEHPNQKIVIDPVSIGKARKIYHYVGEFHTIKCNRLEAEYLSDCSIESLEDVPKAAQALLNKGLKQVFITLGKEGAYYASKDQQGFLPSYAKKVVNVTGAGDAFTAGIVYGMLSQLNIQEIAQFATSMSSLSLESMQTVNPSMSLEKVKHKMREEI